MQVTPMSMHDSLIIGAGPYGLALAAHLRARRAPCTLVGTPMDQWERFMPKGMMLRSEGNASSLSAPGGAWSLEQYCHEHGIGFQPIGWPVPLAVFVAYARWFRINAVGSVIDMPVIKLERAGDGFRALLRNGETLTARNVVLATGLRDFRVIPPALSMLPGSAMTHSCDYGDMTHLVGQDVTIVGGGQSALGLAALLHEQGTNVRVMARRGQIDWNAPPQTARSLLSHLRQPDSSLGAGWRGFLLSNFPGLFRRLPALRRQKMVANSWGPSGAWWLRDRVAGKIEVLSGHEVLEASRAGAMVQLKVQHKAGVSTFTTGHVIAATGFRANVQRMGFLCPQLRAAIATTGGAPELSAHFETSEPGLFMIGQASAQSFGPVMRFVCGTAYAAPKLARHLERIAGPVSKPQPTSLPEVIGARRKAS